MIRLSLRLFSLFLPCFHLGILHCVIFLLFLLFCFKPFQHSHHVLWMKAVLYNPLPVLMYSYFSRWINQVTTIYMQNFSRRCNTDHVRGDTLLRSSPWSWKTNPPPRCGCFNCVTLAPYDPWQFRHFFCINTHIHLCSKWKSSLAFSYPLGYVSVFTIKAEFPRLNSHSVLFASQYSSAWLVVLYSIHASSSSSYWSIPVSSTPLSLMQ